MKVSAVCFGVYLCSIVQSASAQNLTDWELCEAIYREYGMRTEACDQDREHTEKKTEKPLEKAHQLSAEVKESHVFFTQGGATLSDNALQQVAGLASVLETAPMQRACLRLVGHSDSSGGAEINQTLSKQRAESVAAALRAKLQNEARILEVLGVGETQLLEGFPGKSPYHRRVAILARDCR
ncbi:OmpA family protein [Roseovarius sp. EL26]|uniref:OmpA family protein n=1 Tax=Roseovarius sp. EL26 TaxID=2126672 RepID=UPI000EA06ED6|nr:OmpA family protein [Roseovarius sp. EL26]